MLHVHCGDSSAGTLRASGVPGEVVVWCDLLMCGPAPGGASDDEWRRLRAACLSESTGGAVSPDACAARLRAQDEALARSADHDETVLWFDACLYDQLILIRDLAWFAGRAPRDGALSLICVGEFPGLPRFRGLGELSARQMASLFPARHAVTAAETALAVRAWDAFRSADPRALEAVLATDTSALPYLRDALRRHLEQYPSTRNGLGRMEHETLAAVEAGRSTPAAIFAWTSDQEARPYFGDTFLWGVLNGLAAARVPLLRIDGPGPLPQWQPPPDLSAWTARLTPAGREVLSGAQDAVELNGIDRWLGGVHLTAANPWRWDPDGRRLVRAAR